MLVCRVAPLVERCYTYLWLLLRCIAWLPYVLVMFPRTVCYCLGEGFSQDYSVLASVCCCATSGSEVCYPFGWCVLAGFPRAVPWLCMLVKVLPRIAPLLILAEDSSWHCWWRFSTELPCVVLVVAAFFLYRDELSLLPFLGCAGGNSCVPVVGWFASLLAPYVLSQMVAEITSRAISALLGFGTAGDFPTLTAAVHGVTGGDPSLPPSSARLGSSSCSLFGGCERLFGSPCKPICFRAYRSYVHILMASVLPPPLPIKVHSPVCTNSREPAAFFSLEEVRLSCTPLKHAIIARTPVGRPSFQDIRLHLAQRFGFVKEFIISALDGRHLLLRFQDKEDYLKVLLKDMLFVKGYLFRFFQWSMDFSPDEDSSIVPMWVEMPGLPANFYSEPMLKSIAGSIGQVLQVDRDTAMLARTHAARICIQMDIAKDLPERVWIGIGSNGIWKPLYYPNPPVFCKSCKRLGHTDLKCKKSTRGDEQRAPNELHAKQIWRPISTPRPLENRGKAPMVGFDNVTSSIPLAPDKIVMRSVQDDICPPLETLIAPSLGADGRLGGGSLQNDGCASSKVNICVGNLDIGRGIDDANESNSNLISDLENLSTLHVLPVESSLAVLGNVGKNTLDNVSSDIHLVPPLESIANQDMCQPMHRVISLPGSGSSMDNPDITAIHANFVGADNVVERMADGVKTSILDAEEKRGGRNAFQRSMLDFQACVAAADGLFTSSSMRKISQVVISAGWDKLWSPAVPLKWSILAWRLAKGCVPTDDVLAGCGIPLCSMCSCCSSPTIESGTHLFFNSDVAKAVWGSLFDILQFHNSIVLNPTHGVICFLSDQPGCSSFGKLVRFIFLSVLWELWCSRNRSRFDSVAMTSSHVLIKVRMNVQDAIAASLLVLKDIAPVQITFLSQWGIHVQQSSNRIPRIVRWLLPSTGRFKLNVDGAFKRSMGIAAGGGVLRNDRGDVIFCFANRYPHIRSSLETEALALRDGLSLCCSHAVNNILIESDSLVLVQVIKVWWWSGNLIPSLRGVSSSSIFHGLLGLVVLYHGLWCRVAHLGDLCGEGPFPLSCLEVELVALLVRVVSLWVIGRSDLLCRLLLCRFLVAWLDDVGQRALYALEVLVTVWCMDLSTCVVGAMPCVCVLLRADVVVELLKLLIFVRFGVGVAYSALLGLRFLACGFWQVSCGESFLLACVVSASGATVLHLACLLGVGGVELSTSGTLLAGPCLVAVQLLLRGGYFALSRQPYQWYARLWSRSVSEFSPLAWERVCSVVVPCFGLGPFEVDMLSSTFAIVSFLVQFADVLGCLALPTSDIFLSFVSVYVPTLLSFFSFPFLLLPLLSEVGEPPPSFSGVLECGGAGELVAEQWSGVVERGGGGRAFVKALFGFGSLAVAFPSALQFSGSDRGRGWLVSKLVRGRSLQLGTRPVLLFGALDLWPFGVWALGWRLGSRHLLALVLSTARLLTYLGVRPSNAECDRSIRRVQIRRRHPGRRDLVATGWLSPSYLEGDAPVVTFRLPVFLALVVVHGWPTALLGVFGRDPHLREPFEGVLWATSVLELAAVLVDSRAKGKTVVGSGVDHVVVSGMGPQLDRAAVVRVCVFFAVAHSPHSTGEVVDRSQRLASWRCGRCVLLLAASGDGLLAFAVTEFLTLFLSSLGDLNLEELFLPDLVEVRDVGAYVVRLWSHVVGPMFREPLCLGGCVPRFLLLWMVRDWLSLLSLVRKAHPPTLFRHWVSWATIQKPILEGGLGVRSLWHVQLSMVIKLLWNMFHGSSLWVTYARDRFFHDGQLIRHLHGISKKLFFAAHDIVKHNSRWILGNGASISFLDDVWIGMPPCSVGDCSIELSLWMIVLLSVAFHYLLVAAAVGVLKLRI
ncbi:hypothetical protein Taro_016810 [Colocasia esculenta]|uniref:RNase H type-1 domain-containing protein n=1 Tax=Colocasia esculenta TaxID=4460 RepID=A0A843ULS9_COLES|nr:hypothetical protein [Colocasia esculenta]